MWTSRHGRLGRLLLVAIGVGLSVTAAARVVRAEPHSREGVYAGFGFGSGWANLDWEEFERQSQWSGTVAARVGFALRGDLVVGAEFQGWASDYAIATTQGDVPVEVQFSGLHAAVTYFPDGQGFLLKGGVGLAIGSVDVKPPPGVDFPTSGEFTDTGVAVLAGMGYEFRLARSFALGAELDTQFLGVEGEGVRSVFTYGLGLQFNWYW